MTAAFSDGRTRDVTGLSVFEPSNLVVRVDRDGVVHRQSLGETTILVRYLDRQAVVQLAFIPDRPGFVWNDPPENNYIDHHVIAKLRTLRMLPSDLCSDSRVPSPRLSRHARRPADGGGGPPFLADPRSDKRTRLVDELLERPRVCRLLGVEMVRICCAIEEKVLDRKGVRLFHDWIRREHRRGQAAQRVRPRDSSQPAAAATPTRRRTTTAPSAIPNSRAEATAKVFLGIRLQCRQVSQSPVRALDADRITTAWPRSSPRVDYRIVENNRKDKLDKHEFDGEQIVYVSRDGEAKHPARGETLPAEVSSAPTRRRSPRMPTASRRWPIGWRRRTTRSSPAKANRVWAS